MTKKNQYLSIGETAKRCGVAASTLRFYENKGLISAKRGLGNQRRFHRSMIRRISVIKIAQTLGISLGEIAQAFESLPDQRTPTKRDWGKLSLHWRQQLDERISALQRLRDQLDGCIGCGCLSLQRCALYNPRDEAAISGSGPRYLIRDSEGLT